MLTPFPTCHLTSPEPTGVRGGICGQTSEGTSDGMALYGCGGRWSGNRSGQDASEAVREPNSPLIEYQYGFTLPTTMEGCVVQGRPNDYVGRDSLGLTPRDPRNPLEMGSGVFKFL